MRIAKYGFLGLVLLTAALSANAPNSEIARGGGGGFRGGEAGGDFRGGEAGDFRGGADVDNPALRGYVRGYNAGADNSAGWSDSVSDPYYYQTPYYYPPQQQQQNYYNPNYIPPSYYQPYQYQQPTQLPMQSSPYNPV